MKYLVMMPLLGCLLASCEMQSGSASPSAAALRQKAVSKGTLASTAVARDASSTVKALSGGNGRITQYVIKKPSGREGAKTWEELWTCQSGGQESSFMIVFKEDGRGSANYEIDEL